MPSIEAIRPLVPARIVGVDAPGLPVQPIAGGSSVDSFSRGGIQPGKALGLQQRTHQALQDAFLTTNLSATRHRMRMQIINNM